jgi:hypothetical protein
MENLTNIEFLVIVSYYDHDISWVKHLQFPYRIYYKDRIDKAPYTAANKAKSESNIFKFISDFYDVLPQNTIFVHQYESKWYHEGSLVDMLNHPRIKFEYKYSKTPGYWNLNQYKLDSMEPQRDKIIKSGWWRHTMEPYFGNMNDYYDFTKDKGGCAQFIVSRSRIRSLPRSFYQNMYQWLVQNQFGETGPKNIKTKSRVILPSDRHIRGPFFLSRYLEWSYELIFTTYKKTENDYNRIGAVDLLVLYGAGKYMINVTSLFQMTCIVDNEIYIEPSLDFNHIFDDYIYGTPKILKIDIKNKGNWILPEKRTRTFRYLLS